MKTLVSILFFVGLLISNQSFAHVDSHKSGAHRFDHGHWHNKYHRAHGRHYRHRHHYKDWKRRHHYVKRHYARKHYDRTYDYASGPASGSRHAGQFRTKNYIDHGDNGSRRYDRKHTYKHRSDRERRREK